MTDAADVGAYYDDLTPVLGDLWGGNFHIGLWPSDQAAAIGAHEAVTLASDRLTDLLINALPLRPGSQVLDIGCGIGRPAIRLAQTTGATVTGITISPTQVARAAAQAASEGLTGQLDFLTADAAALPFPDYAFDAAWAIESLLHMPECKAALLEIARVLKPDTPLLISDMILRSATTHAHRHSAIMPLPELCRLLTETGFTILTQTSHDNDLRRSLLRLHSDLAADRNRLISTHGESGVAALTRILDKTIPAVGDTYGYTIIAARRGHGSGRP